MRQITKEDRKKALGDRWWIGLVILNAVVAIVVIISLGLSIQPKEVQVITHFSSFSLTGYYRNYWYFLWGYALLELIVVSAHSALSLKLHQLGRRDLALALLWSTIGLSIMILIFGLSIIHIAAKG